MGTHDCDPRDQPHEGDDPSGWVVRPCGMFGGTRATAEHIALWEATHGELDCAVGTAVGPVTGVCKERCAPGYTFEGPEDGCMPICSENEERVQKRCAAKCGTSDGVQLIRDRSTGECRLPCSEEEELIDGTGPCLKR